MFTKEEIEKIALEIYPLSEFPSQQHLNDMKRSGFVKGFNKCQELQPTKTFTCTTCGGSGYIHSHPPKIYDPGSTAMRDAWPAHGTCYTCNGTGQVTKQNYNIEEIEAQIKMAFDAARQLPVFSPIPALMQNYEYQTAEDYIIALKNKAQ